MRFLLILLFIIPLFSFSEENIWFAPNKTEMLNSRSLDGEWSQSRRDIHVFKFYSEIIESSTVESLRQKFDFLRENNIKIAIELPALTWKQNSTGYKIEGFRRPGFSADIIRKIQSAGGSLDYISLDEPITFAAYKSGRNFPNLSPLELSRQLYVNLKPFYNAFPNVKVGDIEALNSIPGEFYSTYLPVFLSDFQGVSGHKIEFIHVDQYWKGDWKTPVIYLNSISRKYKFRVGVIFNASVATNDDSVWMGDARKNVKNYYSTMHDFPDDIIVQSWNFNPINPVGDNDKNANSSLVVFIKNVINNK